MDDMNGLKLVHSAVSWQKCFQFPSLNVFLTGQHGLSTLQNGGNYCYCTVARIQSSVWQLWKVSVGLLLGTGNPSVIWYSIKLLYFLESITIAVLSTTASCLRQMCLTELLAMKILAFKLLWLSFSHSNEGETFIFPAAPSLLYFF